METRNNRILLRHSLIRPIHGWSNRDRNAIKLLQLMGYEGDLVDAAEALAARFAARGNWKETESER